MSDQCRDVQDLFSPYIDDEISRDDREKVEEHNRNCPSCHQLLQDLQADGWELKFALSPYQQELDGKIDDFLRHEPWLDSPTRVGTSRWPLLVGGMAAGFLIALAGFWVINQIEKNRQLDQVQNRVYGLEDKLDQYQRQIEAALRGNRPQPVEYSTDNRKGASPRRKFKFSSPGRQKEREERIFVLQKHLEKGNLTTAGLANLKHQLVQQQELLQNLHRDYAVLTRKVKSFRDGGLGRVTVQLGATQRWSPFHQRWNPIQVGEILTYRSRLRTSNQGKVEVELAGNQLVRLHHDSQLTLLGRRQIKLNQGECWVQLPGNRGKESPTFTVDTKSGPILMKAGQLHLAVDRRGTTLAVYKGVARIKSRNGATEIIPAGALCRFDDQTISPPQATTATVVDGAQWTLDLVRARPHHRPEVKRKVYYLLAKTDQTQQIPYQFVQKIKSYGSASVAPISQYISTKEAQKRPQVRRQAVQILSEVGDWQAVDTFIHLLVDQDPQVRVYSAQGLYRITGENQGYPLHFWVKGEKLDQARTEWKEWWKKNQQASLVTDNAGLSPNKTK